jgi:hypothetical protein
VESSIHRHTVDGDFHGASVAAEAGLKYGPAEDVGFDVFDVVELKSVRIPFVEHADLLAAVPESDPEDLRVALPRGATFP